MSFSESGAATIAVAGRNFHSFPKTGGAAQMFPKLEILSNAAQCLAFLAKYYGSDEPEASHKSPHSFGLS
jgi:hypothetical protein